jgi:hypothetical protein
MTQFHVKSAKILERGIHAASPWQVTEQEA